MRRAHDVHGDPRTSTFAEVVHRAVEVCDPEGVNDGVARLLERHVARPGEPTCYPRAPRH